MKHLFQCICYSEASSARQWVEKKSFKQRGGTGHDVVGDVRHYVWRRHFNSTKNFERMVITFNRKRRGGQASATRIHPLRELGY